MPPGSPVFRLLRDSATLHPTRSAVEEEGGSYSYAELLSVSEALAAQLAGAEARGEIVALLGGKSKELIASMWGVLGAQRAYLVLNPANPLARNMAALEKCRSEILVVCPGGGEQAAAMLSRVGTKLTVVVVGEADFTGLNSQFSAMHRLVSLASAAAPVPANGPARPSRGLAYVSFTSGSTGEPKGVMVAGESVLSYVRNILRLFPIEPGLRFSLFHELTFDITVHDFYLCFATGGTLCLSAPRDQLAPHQYIQRAGIQCWISVPSVVTIMQGLRALKPGKLGGLRYVFFCGEPLFTQQVLDLFSAAPEARVVNLYGPTEATCAITAYECVRGKEPKARNGIVCVGKVFADQAHGFYDGSGWAAEMAGELLLGGSQLALGYINDPERTREKFIAPEAGTGERYYRTGDIFSEDAEGDLFFLGREDHQIKIRGYRVEIHEIEHAIKACAGVSEAVVVPRRDPAGAVRELACFYKASELATPEGIRGELAARLPDYMVPKFFRSVEAFPFNSNGKIDRKTLESTLSAGPGA